MEVRRHKKLDGMAKIGFPISSYEQTFSKLKVGFQVAAANFVVVIFGLFSVKLVSIPM